MKRFNLRQIFLCMSAAGLMGVCNSASAAAFQLWELDAASIGITMPVLPQVRMMRVLQCITQQV